MGRKRLEVGAEKVSISIRIPKNLYEQLKQQPNINKQVVDILEKFYKK